MAQCYRNSGSLKNGMAAQAHRTSGSFAPRLFTSIFRCNFQYAFTTIFKCDIICYITHSLCQFSYFCYLLIRERHLCHAGNRFLGLSVFSNSHFVTSNTTSDLLIYFNTKYKWFVERKYIVFNFYTKNL